MNDKMNNSTLRATIKNLNEVTNQEFLVNSFDMGTSDKTQYGLVKKSIDGKMDIILDAKYTKREIYYHVQGYLILHNFDIPQEKEEIKPSKPIKKKSPTKKKK